MAQIMFEKVKYDVQELPTEKHMLKHTYIVSHFAFYL